MPCHNDLLNANFIDDGARIRIVDWEYAGMGDRWFDLGNYVEAFNELDDLPPEQRARACFQNGFSQSKTAARVTNAKKVKSNFS